MKRATRIVAAGLGTCLAIGLTACTSGSGDNTTAPPAAEAEADTTTTADGDAPADGASVDLTYWDWAPGIEKSVDLWNAKNNGIHVTLVNVDGGDAAITKLLTAVQAGSGAPDIMHIEYQMIPTLVAADALADIGQYLDPASKDGFGDGVWNSVTLGSDAVYGVPGDFGPLAFFYRADIFDQYGLTVPTTWDEYAQVARDLHAAAPDTYLGTFSSNDPGWFTGLTQQAGASWWGIEGDSWKVDVASEATKKVASYWGALVEEGAILNTPMYTPEWVAALTDGTQAGWLSASWAPSVLISNAPDTQGKWKVAPLPQWDAAKPASGTWGGSGTGVTIQSQHPAEAAQFIEWLNATEEGVQAMLDLGQYPANDQWRNALATKPPEFFSDQADYVEIMNSMAAVVNSFTYGPNVNVAYSAYNDEFAKACETKTQAAFTAAVDAMQSATLDDLKNSGFSVTE